MLISQFNLLHWKFYRNNLLLKERSIHHDSDIIIVFLISFSKIVSVVDSFKIAKRFNYLINRSKSYKAIQTKYLNKIYDLFKNTLDYNFIDYFT